MRFLKNKIARARGLSVLSPSSLEVSLENPKIPTDPIKSSPTRMSSTPKSEEIKSPPNFKKQLSGDNIIKNYGRAMTNFAISTPARSYLAVILPRLNVSLQAFYDYIKQRKSSANCIKQLRAMLPIGDEQSEEELNLKKVFQEICIIFLKFFCVNWLYSSKISEKVAHLKYRFKIMRRVKNPQYFTYLKDFHSRN